MQFAFLENGAETGVLGWLIFSDGAQWLRFGGVSLDDAGTLLGPGDVPIDFGVAPAVAAAVAGLDLTGPAGDAVTAALSNAAPVTDGLSAVPGTGVKVSRDTHSHQSRAGTGTGVTNSSGLATIAFSRAFDVQPIMGSPVYEEVAGTQPILFHRVAWIKTGAQWTGVTIQAQRAQVIPTNLVTALLGGVFNLFAGGVSGVAVEVIALQP